MVSPFEFITAGRILFGVGKLRELPNAARQIGNRALLVCGSASLRAEPVRAMLDENGVETFLLPIPGEPTIEQVTAGGETARSVNACMVIGFGGGSAIDAAKAIAALATNPGPPLKYLEVIGQAEPLSHSPLPIVAIPTTAGAGAEVTRNAVLASTTHRVKVSLRHPALLPRIAIIDPETTRSLPDAVTASTGMDALTQLIEPFVSVRANSLVDALCRDGIRRASAALPRAFEDGGNIEARSDMSYASLLGGIALTNAGLGAVHGFAAPIGGMFPASHGAVCAALLPAVMAMNVRVAIRTRDYRTIERYADVARLLTGDQKAPIDEGFNHVSRLSARLKIPRLRDFSITAGDLPEIASKAATSSSMKGNAVPLDQPQLLEVLEAAW